MRIRRLALGGLGLAAAFAASCATEPTSVPVTLTAPVPTATVAPVDVSPSMEIGSAFVYADGSTVVAVPHGPFIMGHGSADDPQHSVTLSDYWIYATEVTNRQYAICVDQGLCSPPDPSDDPSYSDFEAQNRPVVGVTYDQARAYCNFMYGDLPTEAEWEKAARGPEGSLYPWGAKDPSCELLNFGDCLKHSSDVTGYAAGRSVYGALNMAGNVYEWVADWYDPLYYKTSPAGDPPGPQAGSARVVRSSGYHSTASQSLSYTRSLRSPRDHHPDLGFRCVVQDLSHFAPACALASTVAPADMAAVSIECPNISIDVQVTACRYGGGAVVTFNDDHPQDSNAAFGGIVGCTLLSGKPGSFPLSYQCLHASTAVLSSSCTYSGVQSGECRAHYTLNPTTGACQWDGSRTSGIDCPVGEFYDPVHHCCLVTSGKLPDFPVCPVGSVFTETSSEVFACLPSESVRTVPEQSADINPPVCGHLCELSTALCSLRNLVFCETNCTCLAVGVKCPTH